MPAQWIKRIIGAAILAAVAGGLARFAWPRPVLVDLAIVGKGPIEVTADDDGKTDVPMSTRSRPRSRGRS
ncbi:hypothetical protein ABIA45_007839 [Bradyrhizobium sp. USDA 336]